MSEQQTRGEAPAPKFTDKQQAFIDAYVTNGKNGTQAAITAGYSETSARVIAHENLTKPDIRAEINRLLREHTMPPDEVLSRLSDHASGDLGDVTGDDGTFDWKTARENGKTSLIKKVKRKTRREHRKDGLVVETVDEEIEFHNPQIALQLLGKYHGLFTEKTALEVSGPNGGPIETAAKVDVSERMAELAAWQKQRRAQAVEVPPEDRAHS